MTRSSGGSLLRDERDVAEKRARETYSLAFNTRRRFNACSIGFNSRPLKILAQQVSVEWTHEYIRLIIVSRADYGLTASGCVALDRYTLLSDKTASFCFQVGEFLAPPGSL